MSPLLFTRSGTEAPYLVRSLSAAKRLRRTRCHAVYFAGLYHFRPPPLPIPQTQDGLGGASLGRGRFVDDPVKSVDQRVDD